MKEYCVSVPIAGYAIRYVEAGSEEAAIERALSEVQLSDMEEWDALRQIVAGNVFCGPMNEIEVEEVEEIE